MSCAHLKVNQTLRTIPPPSSSLPTSHGRGQVRVAGGLNDALVMNNIGAARDEAFISTTVNRLGELLRRNVQAVRMSGQVHIMVQENMTSVQQQHQ